MCSKYPPPHPLCALKTYLILINVSEELKSRELTLAQSTADVGLRHTSQINIY